jgi:UDP-N-acetylmuramoyl-tripeptide--D-alanyl-D-alanine ligase
MENIAKAKVEIVESLKPGSLFVYNGDDAYLKQAVIDKVIPGYIRIKTFGTSAKCECIVSDIKQKMDGLTFKMNNREYHLDMIGSHNAINASAAYLAAVELGLSEEEIVQGFKSIEKTGLRNELIAFGKCCILNDAYKSNPQSALAAMDTMESFDYQYRIAVLADMLELGDTSDMIHYQLGKDLAKYHVDEVLTYGEMARYIAQGANVEQLNVRHFESKEDIIAYLKPYADKECMILIKGSRGMRLEDIVEGLVKE